MGGRCSASVGEEVWQGEVRAAAGWVEFVGTTKRNLALGHPCLFYGPLHSKCSKISGSCFF